MEQSCSPEEQERTCTFMRRPSLQKIGLLDFHKDLTGTVTGAGLKNIICYSTGRSDIRDIFHEL